MNTEQLDMASIYGIPSCANGDCTPGTIFAPNQSSTANSQNRIPTLEEIAGYNSQNPRIPAPISPIRTDTSSAQQNNPAVTPPASNQGTANPLTPLTAAGQPMPISGESLQYLNGFLRTQLGRTVTVEFLIGANTLVDRTGTLLAVGANYILINETQTDDITACDFYNIKFVRFYY